MLPDMPLLVSAPPPLPVRGSARRLAVIGLAIALVLAGAAAWSAVHPGSYDRPRAGCVTVTIPSSTGGALLHACGSRARAMCRHARRHDGRLAVLSRPGCRAAGLR